MSQNRKPEDEDMQEFMARLEREFKPRGSLPDEPPPVYRDPAAVPMPARDPVTVPPFAAPQQVRLTLPLARPWVVYVLLAANVVMYGLSMLLANRIQVPFVDATYGFVSPDGFTSALYVLGAKENNAINAGQWWRLLTPMVLHGSLMHLLFNSLALYNLGVDAEQLYGTGRFVVVYGLAGLAGSIASYLFNPEALSVGASGAIFGLLGALAAFTLTSRTLMGAEATKMQLGQMATLVGINLFLGFVTPNIDNSAHIGGLIVGGLVGFALAPRYAVEQRGYTPVVVRRDRPAIGWLVAVIVAVGLLALFVASQMFVGGR